MGVFRKIIYLINYFRCKFFKKMKTSGLGLISLSSKIQIKKGNLNVGRKLIISDYTEIRSYGSITIGDNFFLNKFSRIIAHENISIGKNVTIAQFVSILDHDHNYVFQNDEMNLDGYLTSRIIIGNNVWISDKVSVLKGVEIGDNVIIGANSVVNNDIPSNSIAAGCPCKVVRKLN